MKFSLKKLLVPSTNEVKYLDALQLWEVRWKSYKDRWDTNGQPEMECFTEESLAKAFKIALEQANQLCRHKRDFHVSVTKQETDK